jgi:DNA-binding NtrC family response regulator
MSGYLEPSHASDAIREAGLPFLLKPFAPDNLSEAVRTALDRRPVR